MKEEHVIKYIELEVQEETERGKFKVTDGEKDGILETNNDRNIDVGQKYGVYFPKKMTGVTIMTTVKTYVKKLEIKGNVAKKRKLDDHVEKEKKDDVTEKDEKENQKPESHPG